MKLNLSPWHYEELIKKSYSLDHIFLLKLIHENYDVSGLVENSLKIDAIHQGLARKGLITDNGALTTIGIELLVFLDSKEETKLVKRKSATSDFELWWNTYRSTDTIFIGDKNGDPTDKNILFEGTRGLKVKKEECNTKFNKILLEGVYTVDDLINALKYEINIKIKKSIETKENKLSYFQNSLTYLTQKTYENFIEISKTKKIILNNSSGTDI